MRNLSASNSVKRSSSARSSSSCPCARSVPSGSDGSMRLATTSCSDVGRWSTNHATLSRADPLDRRWKSSSTSTSSSSSTSAFTSRGSTTSSSGAAATIAGGTASPSAGHDCPSASITCDHSTTSSLSRSSSVTHATGRSSTSRHADRSVDLPNPAGDATRLSRRPRPSFSRANSRSRTTVCAGTTGEWSLVSTRIGASGRPGGASVCTLTARRRRTAWSRSYAEPPRRIPRR